MNEDNTTRINSPIHNNNGVLCEEGKRACALLAYDKQHLHIQNMFDLVRNAKHTTNVTPESVSELALDHPVMIARHVSLLLLNNADHIFKLRLPALGAVTVAHCMCQHIATQRCNETLLHACLFALTQILRLEVPQDRQEWLTKHPMCGVRERVLNRHIDLAALTQASQAAQPSSNATDINNSNSSGTQEIQATIEAIVEERLLLGRYLYSIAKVHHHQQANQQQQQSTPSQPQQSTTSQGGGSGDPIGALLVRTFYSEAVSVWNSAHTLIYSINNGGSASTAPQKGFLENEECADYFMEYEDASLQLSKRQSITQQGIRPTVPRASSTQNSSSNTITTDNKPSNDNSAMSSKTKSKKSGLSMGKLFSFTKKTK